jgi:hypothetical protein
LQELAGVLVKTKQVERVSVQLGVQFEALCQREQQAILSGKLAPLLPPVPILYIAIHWCPGKSWSPPVIYCP